jgi:hypothetical protein
MIREREEGARRARDDQREDGAERSREKGRT